MLLLDTPMHSLPTGSTPSFRRSRSLNNLEMSISLLDEGNSMTKLVPSKGNNHEDETEMVMMEMFSQFGDFDNNDDEFLRASLTSSSSGSQSCFGGNPLAWTRQSEDVEKRTSCAPAEVMYDCFGFPLFDLQADGQPAGQQVKLQVPVPVPVTPASTTDDTVDAEKAARRARRRRSKHAVKNQDTSAPSVPVVTLAVPQPQPHAPMRRRRSTGLLSSSAISHPWHQDSAKGTEANSSAPTKGSSKRANGGHRAGSKSQRRKSLGDGGMRAAMTNVSQSVPSPPQYQRTNSVQLSQNSHQKKNYPRQTRRSLSNGNLRQDKEEQPVATKAVDKPNTDKKANRRRSSNGKRRGSMNAMSKSDTGHSNRRPSMKSSVGSSSAPNHSHNPHHKSSSTLSGRRSTVAAMEGVYEQNTTPDDNGRRDRRRSQRKDMSVTNKRFNRSMSRMNIKRQDSGPSLTTS